MGVKTIVFGPRAWVFLEGMAHTYDEFMLNEKDVKKKKMMKEYFYEFLFIIGFILPCVYCRISYQTFTNPKKPEIDIKKLVNMKNGGKTVVYELHNRVNKKLWDQEKEKNRNDRKKLFETNQRWKNYCISFQTALKTRYKPADSYEFWYNTVVFLGLVMCDYRKSECHLYFRFFDLIGKILILSVNENVRQLGIIYYKCLESSSDMWKQDMAFSRRIGIVWCIIKNIFLHQRGWSFNHNLESFEKQCRKSIVGCDK
jgi:hypothetical protein